MAKQINDILYGQTTWMILVTWGIINSKQSLGLGLKKTWQEKLADVQLYTQAWKNVRRRSVAVNGIYEIYSADLVEMQKFNEWNAGLGYFLMLLDVFSKYGEIRLTKNKKGVTIAKAITDILTKNNKHPKRLRIEKGKELNNTQFKNILKLHHARIPLYSTQNVVKSCVWENRTYKNKLWRQFAVPGNSKYLEVLPTILKVYWYDLTEAARENEKKVEPTFMAITLAVIPGHQSLQEVIA